MDVSTEEELTKRVAEELVDATFYCLNGIYCLNPCIDVDKEFDRQ